MKKLNLSSLERGTIVCIDLHFYFSEQTDYDRSRSWEEDDSIIGVVIEKDDSCVTIMIPAQTILKLSYWKASHIQFDDKLSSQEIICPSGKTDYDRVTGNMKIVGTIACLEETFIEKFLQESRQNYDFFHLLSTYI